MNDKLPKLPKVDVYRTGADGEARIRGLFDWGEVRVPASVPRVPAAPADDQTGCEGSRKLDETECEEVIKSLTDFAEVAKASVGRLTPESSFSLKNSLHVSFLLTGLLRIYLPEALASVRGDGISADDKRLHYWVEVCLLGTDFIVDATAIQCGQPKIVIGLKKNLPERYGEGWLIRNDYALTQLVKRLEKDRDQ